MMFREVSRFWLAALALMLVAGCTSSPRAPAPVETRGSSPKVSAPVAAVPAAEAVKVMPGAENAGKPGYYTVQRGDTLTRIALDHGQTWRDLVSWNSLANANLIEVGSDLACRTSRRHGRGQWRGGAADWGNCPRGDTRQASASAHNRTLCQ